MEIRSYIPVLVFLLSIGWALLANRAEMAQGHQLFLHAAEAFHIAQGCGVGDVDTQNPPGYPLLVAPLIRLGLAPMTAGWVVSLAAFGGVAVSMFIIANRACGLLAATATWLLIMAQRPIIWLANSPVNDISCIFSTCIACLVTEQFCALPSDAGRKVRYALAVAAGLLLASAYWLRYPGILICLLGVGRLLYLSVRAKERRYDAITAIAVMALAALPIVFWQYHLLTTSIDPRLSHPGQGFGYVLTQALYLIGREWIPPIGKVIYFGWKVFVAVVVAAVGLLIARSNFKMPLMSMPSLFLVCYLPFFSLLASRARIDMMNARYTAPIDPYIALGVMVFVWQTRALFWYREKDWKPLLVQALGLVVAFALIADGLAHFKWIYLREASAHLARSGFEIAAGAVLAIALLVIAIAKVSDAQLLRRKAVTLVGGMLVVFALVSAAKIGAYGLGSKQMFSPQSTQYLLAHTLPGETVAGNWATQEILTRSTTVKLDQIPFFDPWNENQNKETGTVLWDRKSALKLFIKDKVHYVAFCFGNQHSDPLIAGGHYGEYVPLLASDRTALPEVADRIHLADGLIVRLGDQKLLESILNAMDRDNVR